MTDSIDDYLEALLAYAPSVQDAHFGCRESVSLIQVPAGESETVYTITFREKDAVLTVVRFKKAVWEEICDSALVEGSPRPQVEVLRAEVDFDHPVFDYLNGDTFDQCENLSDGRPGMDYYMLLREDGEAGAVAECWEPYRKQNQAWMTVIGAMQALSSQFEYKVNEDEQKLALA